MKYLILIIALLINLRWLALAQLPPIHNIWGISSNGICAGISIVTNSFKNDFECSIEVGNTTTNRLYIWVPPLKQRYQIELFGPDGRQIRQIKPPFWSQKVAWLGLMPLAKNGSLDWFFLKDTFDIKTNGQFNLIASVQVNAFTNFAIGRLKMRSKPSYFWLPSVTNSFTISPAAK